MATDAPTRINWLAQAIDFSTAAAAKPTVTPAEAKKALLSRAKAPERSTTAYVNYPQTPTPTGQPPLRHGTAKKLSAKQRISKVLRRGMAKKSKTWHPEGEAAALFHRAEADALLLRAVPRV
jgi:hypothetical protein